MQYWMSLQGPGRLTWRVVHDGHGGAGGSWGAAPYVQRAEG